MAFLTKATILFLAPGFLIALLASKHRSQLLRPEPWIALGAFLVLASPYLIWNCVNHWPTIAYWVSYGLLRVYRYSFPEYLANIALTMGFALVPFLAAGLYRIFRPFSGRSFSFFGIQFLTAFVIVFILRTRAIILAEMCIPIVAAAGVWMEEKLRRSGWMMSLRIGAVSLLVAGGILGAPLSLPILPESSLPAYAKTFGFPVQGPEGFQVHQWGSPSLFARQDWLGRDGEGRRGCLQVPSRP